MFVTLQNIRDSSLVQLGEVELISVFINPDHQPFYFFGWSDQRMITKRFNGLFYLADWRIYEVVKKCS